jgi:hypothetical protein
LHGLAKLLEYKPIKFLENWKYLKPADER